MPLAPHDICIPKTVEQKNRADAYVFVQNIQYPQSDECARRNGISIVPMLVEQSNFIWETTDDTLIK